MHPDQISVSFSVEILIIMSIGEKMNDIHEEAYMNGYNWEAFLNFYLAINDHDVAINMEIDPEAGMYDAYYELNDEKIRFGIFRRFKYEIGKEPSIDFITEEFEIYKSNRLSYLLESD